ncbi:MAG: hypothetical protein U1E10_00040 [Bdellovibrionales bacterium]|jgi:hypothetical protein|nr:hypothetical protein [Bdellovibrionales bacterium]
MNTCPIRKFGFAVLSLLTASTFAAHAFAEPANTPVNIPIEDVPEAAKKIGIRNQTELNSYLEITDVTVTEDARSFSSSELLATEWLIANGTANDPTTATNSAGDLGSGIGGALTDLFTDLGDVKKWVTLGQKLWELIRNNQPVVNVKTQTVSVLPLSKPNWTEMETWKGPAAKSYTVAAKNLYGMTVISHTYTVAFHHGGSLGGRGQFLANATIIPTNINVSWGFTLNSKVTVGQPLNTGTMANPIPGLDLGLEWSMSSVLKKSQGTDQFYVRGDGTSTHVNLY